MPLCSDVYTQLHVIDMSQSLADLPTEIIAKIASHLRPVASTSTYPNPSAQSLDVTTLTLTSGKVTADLLSLSYTCRKVYIVVRTWLYHALPLVTTRQVRLLAQSLTQAYQPKVDDLQEYNNSRQLRHVFMPNDGLLLGNDSLSDQLTWAPSLRTIFRTACLRLETVLLGCRPDGAILSEFLDPEVLARPRRLTILNFFSSPPFSLYNLAPLSRVTHLHCINLIPRDPILRLLSGQGSQRSHPIQVIRLSQLYSEALQDFADYVRWRRDSEHWDSQVQTQGARPRNGGGEGPPSRPKGPARRFEAQETLYALATASHKMTSFRSLVLELGELSRLPEPEDIPLLSERASTETADQTPSDSSADDPSFEAPVVTSMSVDLDGQAEMRELINDAERTRTATRDAYWIDTRAGKEALQALFDECRSRPMNGDSASSTSSTATGTAMAAGLPVSVSRVEVRIAAPKPGGWDQNECRQDFESQVQACQAESSLSPDVDHLNTTLDVDDGTCFSDPDVFWLAENRPWLSYDGEHRSDYDPTLGADWRRPDGKGTWWTGVLPRYDAGRSSA
ncbi:unnamed protein product [Parajaminaea phylloscopi]